MTYRKVPLVSGEYFHIYNRGNSKQKIFLDDEDKERFIKLLYLSNSKKNIKFRDHIINTKIDAWDFEKGDNVVSIGAWVLMQNHFHLYLTSLTSGMGEAKNKISDVSLFMKKLCTSYSKYFNKKYDRTGSLFEGRFKSVLVSDDVQAKYLFSYIHLNPIKLIDKDWKENGIKNKYEALKFLSEYKWGSYMDYKRVKRKETKILDRNNFINYFKNYTDFDEEILDWIKKK
jgi:hypothetical protein